MKKVGFRRENMVAKEGTRYISPNLKGLSMEGVKLLCLNSGNKG